MANQKSSKVFDVAKPGKSAPSSSAKPIIITNRPVLKDPMVTDDDKPTEEEKPAETRNSTRARVQIKPLHDLGAETTDDTPEAAPETPVTAEAEAPSAPDLPAVKPAKPKNAKPVAGKAEPKPEAAPRMVTSTTDAEPSKAAGKPEPAAEPVEDTKEEEASAPAAVPEPKPEPSDAPAAAPAKEPEAAEEPNDTIAKEVPAETTSESDPQAEVSVAAGDNAAELAAKREQERAEELAKIALSHKYYLPINQSGRRHARHMAWLGVFVIILLALAWADVALDAGIIKIPGVKAPVRIINK